LTRYLEGETHMGSGQGTTRGEYHGFDVGI
jgi:hypothetical protein